MVSDVVVLDSGPLGLASNPNRSPLNRACSQWLKDLAAAGTLIVVPEIIDYELRRELLRGGKQSGVERLDQLIRDVDYLAINSRAMRRAAEHWAAARQAGQPTAADDTIDIDMILIAQVETAGYDDAVVATTNVSHL
jgi:predicted nucleic acid-binding protein